MSGLSIKYIRRLKSSMPKLFDRHTDRGQNNAILFDEEIIETMKRMREMKNRGKTLAQIRNEILQVAKREQEKRSQEEPKANLENENTESSEISETSTVQGINIPKVPVTKMLQRENDMLKSQVELLKHLLKKAEERFDRLLPEPGKTSSKLGQTDTNQEKTKKMGFKTQMFMWLVEAVVVTAFATGFIFMIWLFAQRAFSL